MENSPVQRFLQFTSWLGVNPEDGEDLRLEKSILLIGSGLVILASLVWGGAFLAWGEIPAALISFFYSLAALASLGVYALSRDHVFFRSTQLLLGLILPFLQSAILGGIWSSSMVMLWSLAAPLGASLLSDREEAIRWMVAYLGLVILSGFLQPLVQRPNNMSLEFRIGLQVVNILAVSGIAFVTILYFVNRKDEILQKLRREEQKSERLLLNVLPREIAAVLRDDDSTIAEEFESASILFADLVGFTTLSASMAPTEMVRLLNEIFSQFDALVEKYGLEKIRTIGDNYMVAAGVPRPNPDHAAAIACLALDMQAYLQSLPPIGGERISFRIGINSGPVIGGVIGRKKFVYDVWGDAVNIASRMESQGIPGKIQLARGAYERICERFACELRGEMAVKGRGDLETWFLLGPLPG